MSFQEVPEELKKIGITSMEQFNDIKVIAKTKFFESKKPKPVKAKIATGGKKTDRQIFLGRIASASDLSKSKVDEITDPKEKADTINKRGDDFRKNMSSALGKTVLDEAEVLKIVKSGTAVLLDIHVFDKPDAKPAETSSNPPSTQ